jgi:putative ABC transport system ATP-binding protein
MTRVTGSPEPDAVAVHGVSKTYPGGIHAVRDVSLRVPYGEVTFLMGPSGSGKTTLLSIMGCILKPTAGAVLLRGRDVTALRERDLPAVRRKEIGFVFQSFNLFPSLTASENVQLALNTSGQNGPGARQRARELLQAVGMADRGDSFPAHLSGGQNQRVAIARALAANPRVILADEPTAALDFPTARLILELLREVTRQDRRAAIVVTHDARLREFADRVVHLEDGRVAGTEGRS